MKDGLVSWKKKRDKYDEEYVDDETDAFSPRLTATLNEPTFVRRDEFNAKAMRIMRMKRWW